MAWLGIIAAGGGGRACNPTASREDRIVAGEDRGFARVKPPRSPDVRGELTHRNRSTPTGGHCARVQVGVMQLLVYLQERVAYKSALAKLNLCTRRLSNR